MADMREAAALFSLKHLMKLEQVRAREEERDAERRADAEMAARVEAEHRMRLEQERLLRAEDARRHAAEAARREEAARHEAIRMAEAERVRLEAEQRARIALLELQQAHERKLAALEQDALKRRLKDALCGGAVLAVLLFGGFAAAYFGHIRPQAELTRRQERAAIAAYEADVQRLKTEMARANKQADDAKRALDQANKRESE